MPVTVIYHLVVLVVGLYYIAQFVRYLGGVAERSVTASKEHYDNNQEEIKEFIKRVIPQREEVVVIRKTLGQKIRRGLLYVALWLFSIVTVVVLILHNFNFAIGLY